MNDSLVHAGWSQLEHRPNSDEHDLFVGDMAEYPQLQYSMKAVKRAGKRLAENVDWCEADRDGILETFAIANSWRDSHVLPMRSLRYSVLQRMRACKIGGFTAARPKRMSSIRKKLQRLGTHLDQINDLAGCRAIVDDINGVNSLIENCRERLPHELRQEYHYIDEPKNDGYRSHHMIFRFNGKGSRAVFDGRRVELQIRTRLQHSWATAVEAVGLYRGEDMKAGEGDADWLRLFQLMSAEFAYSENCPVPEYAPERMRRIEEIRHLNTKIHASGLLEDIRNVTHYVLNHIHDKPRYYLIKYDIEKHTVTVQPYSNALESTDSFGSLERSIAQAHNSSKAVLVEVDRADRLAEAYPNYFGDVSLFVRNLKAISGGFEAVEYTMAPQRVVAPKQHEKPDMSWLMRRYRRWTDS